MPYTFPSISKATLEFPRPSYNLGVFPCTHPSGSPIIQNGKIVGAVTHVLVGYPTTGYGIFIENMLTAVNIPMAKAS